MGVKAVIFDMDGLMFDTERLSLEAWIKAGNELGIEIPEELLMSVRGCNYKSAMAQFYKYLGADLDYDDLRGRRTRHFNEEIEKKGLPVKKGLRELLAYLKENGYPVSLGTSSHYEVAMRHLDSVGIKEYFDTYVCGDMVENAKPAPEIFLTAAEKLGVAPADCAVLEDSVNGILAGIAGGFRTVMVPDLMLPPPELEEQLAARCSSLLDVIELLKDGKL